MTKQSNRFWQLYVAAAHIEERINLDVGAAQRIFQNAFKYFKDAPEFVICFVDFLMDQTDEALAAKSRVQLRQIFEHILPQFDGQHKDTQRIWRRFIEFEARSAVAASDVAVLQRAERKRDDVLDCNRIQRLLHSVERCSFLDLLPVTKQYRDTLLHAQQTAQRKAAQKLSAMQNKNVLNTRHRLGLDPRGFVERNRIASRIKLNAFELNDPIHDRQSDWVDMTTLIDDGDTDSITVPEVAELVAFRPGIRFLSRVDDDEEDGDEDADNEEEDILKMYPKLKELKQRLPPPPQTQLLYLDKMDRNATKMVDVESFITFMSLRLNSFV